MELKLDLWVSYWPRCWRELLAPHGFKRTAALRSHLSIIVCEHVCAKCMCTWMCSHACTLTICTDIGLVCICLNVCGKYVCARLCACVYTGWRHKKATFFANNIPSYPNHSIHSLFFILYGGMEEKHKQMLFLRCHGFGLFVHAWPWFQASTFILDS